MTSTNLLTHPFFCTHIYAHSNNDDAQTPLESFAFELSSSPFLIQALAEGSLEDPFPAFRKVLARISVAEVRGSISCRGVFILSGLIRSPPSSLSPSLSPPLIYRKSPS